MKNKLRIGLAQLNFLVGDIENNTKKIIKIAEQARDDYHADMVVYSELSVCGYPPEDLLFRENMLLQINKARKQLLAVKDIVLVVGLPAQGKNGLENCVEVFFNGQILFVYAKQNLPNYNVFDEKRYFVPGAIEQKRTFTFKGINFAIGICEDYWSSAFNNQINALNENIHILLSLNASPYHDNKAEERLSMMHQCCTTTDLPMVYVNQIGAQDELVFDGSSFVMDAKGVPVLKADTYKEQLYIADYCIDTNAFIKGYQAPEISYEAKIYQALMLGIHDYVVKNGFNGVVLGLSGGIDSALVLAIAVDALGKERVKAVMMPFHYTSQMSIENAQAEAATLDVEYNVLPIASVYEAFIKLLAEEFKGLNVDTTEENLQARCRGMLLMAISNKKGLLVITTGNKSEMSIGYTTLYGDMAGGFCVLKDVSKTMVYQLSRWRNEQSSVIPQQVLMRAPSAELSPGQVDQDNLPSYDILDQILKRYIEEDQSAKTIMKAGFDKKTVNKIVRLVDLNEYKRRQAPVGVKITTKAFGRDRRYPVTSGWKE